MRQTVEYSANIVPNFANWRAIWPYLHYADQKLISHSKPFDYSSAAFRVPLHSSYDHTVSSMYMQPLSTVNNRGLICEEGYRSLCQQSLRELFSSFVTSGLLCTLVQLWYIAAEQLQSGRAADLWQRQTPSFLAYSVILASSFIKAYSTVHLREMYSKRKRVPHKEIFLKNEKNKTKTEVKNKEIHPVHARSQWKWISRVCFIIRHAAQYKTPLSYRGVFAEMRR